MAKAKRKAGGGGDSKQALTIILVFFVLLAIITGVVAYYGYAEQEDLRKNLVKAKAETKLVGDDRTLERRKKALVRILMGVGEQNNEATLDDSANVGVMKSQNPKDLADEIDRVKKVGYKDLTWDDASNKPAVSLVARIGELEKDKADLQTKLTAAEADVKAAQKQKDEAITKAAMDLAVCMQKVADSEAKLKEISGMKSVALDNLSKINADLQAEKEKALRDAELIKEDLVKKNVDLEKKSKELEAKAKTLQERVAPINMLDFQEPKGEVVSVDRATGRTAYINLGSLDRVKPNLTFAIYGKGVKPKPGVERKGSLEVVEVTAAHLAKCRITEVAGGTRDPIMPGDVLFNQTWNPTLREHVAIVGNIDLTGDGTDDSAELVRNLESQGIIIDAYLDPKDGTVKGRGMTGETNYLVLGAGIPQYEEKIVGIRREAAALGVTVVPARRYMALIGYRLPPGTAAGDWSVYSVMPAAGLKPAAPMENPAPEKPPADAGK